MTTETAARAFNAHATFTLRADRMYRVYATGDDLHFIRIGGQPINWVAALNQLALLGVWIGRKLNARREAALAAKIAEVDLRAPEDQIYDHKHNYRVSVHEVASATFEPGKAVSLNGPYAGAWKLTMQNGDTSRFQFEVGADAQQALHVLTEALRDRLSVEAAWDEKAERYTKLPAEGRALDATAA